MTRPRCENGKVRFRSRGECKRAMTGFKVRMRIYRCPLCRDLHVTKESIKGRL